MAEDYAHETSQNVTRMEASPRPDVANVYGARGAYQPDANLSQLLGEGETTYFQNAVPSNVVTLPAALGGRVEMTFTNNGKWPLLLKAAGVNAVGAAPHFDWVWQLQRSDGAFPIGQGWHHALNLTGTGVPLLLGNGLHVGKNNSYTIRFQNLSALATDIGVVFKALQIANPEQVPIGHSLMEQVASLNALARKWAHWSGLSPYDTGLGLKLLQEGHFYTFPLQSPVVVANDARFGGVDLAAAGLNITQASFRNETGGTFIWEGIVYHSSGAAVPGDPFSYQIELGGGSWKMTQGAVDSRLFTGGRNPIGQWVPIPNPKPWIIPNGTTVEVLLRSLTAAFPTVWFEAVGTIVGARI